MPIGKLGVGHHLSGLRLPSSLIFLCANIRTCVRRVGSPGFERFVSSGTVCLAPAAAMSFYAQKVSLPLSLPTMMDVWQRFSAATPMEVASPQVDVLIAQDEFKAFRDGICVRTSVETPASAHVRAHIHREPQRKSERKREIKNKHREK